MTTVITIMDDEPDRDGGEFWRDRIPLDIAGGENADAPSGQSADAAARLLIWLSPAFPVGSFAFSHALEWAVHRDKVSDVATTITWLGALLEHGALRNDAIFVSCAWRATRARDARGLREVNEQALAMAGSRERYLEATAQGNAFVAIIRQAWRAPGFDWASEHLKGDVAYPIAVGVVSAAHEIALGETLRSFVLAQIQNLISAVIRLSVIGHTDGQRAIAALLPAIGALAQTARSATLDDVGGAAFQSDIAAMAHETQYSRLFRS